MVPRKAGRSLEAQLPVPDGCELATLRVAWVRKAESAAADDADVPAVVTDVTAVTADALIMKRILADPLEEVRDPPMGTTGGAAMPDVNGASAPNKGEGGAGAASSAEQGNGGRAPTAGLQGGASGEGSASKPPPAGPCDALARACRCIPTSG